jgi:hypothetical protein
MGSSTKSGRFGCRLFQSILVALLVCLSGFSMSSVAQNESAVQNQKKTDYTLVPGRSPERLRILLDETNSAINQLSSTLGNNPEFKTHQQSLDIIADQISKLQETESGLIAPRLESLRADLVTALGEIKLSIDSIQGSNFQRGQRNSHLDDIIPEVFVIWFDVSL